MLILCRFDKIFPLVLEQIQPVCVAEQKFLNSFFHFERIEPVLEESKEHPDDYDEEMDGSAKKVPNRPSDTVVGASDVGSHNLLNQLFAALLPEIEDFIDFGDRHDS